MTSWTRGLLLGLGWMVLASVLLAAGVAAGDTIGRRLNSFQYCLFIVSVVVVPNVLVRWLSDARAKVFVLFFSGAGLSVMLFATNARFWLGRVSSAGERISVLLGGAILVGLFLWSVIVPMRCEVDSKERRLDRTFLLFRLAPYVSQLIAVPVLLTPLGQLLQALPTAIGLAAALALFAGLARLAAHLPLALLGRDNEQIPPRLQDALRRLETRCAVRFARVLWLPHANGRYCEVHWGVLGQPVLVLSNDVLRRLGDEELLAVLAHEAAHVKFRHSQVRGWMSFALAYAFALGVATTNSGLGVLPILVFGALILRYFIELSVTRYLERHADRFAAEVVGAAPLRTALERCVPVPSSKTDFSAWMAHDSPQRRLAALESESH